MKKHLVTLAVLCALSGCSGSNPAAFCTQIGCDSGITVHLAEKPAGTYRVDVYATSPGQQPAYTYECTVVAQCRQDIFFTGLIVRRVFVKVTTASGSRMTEIGPINYTSYRPNGPSCAPDCQTATVTAEVP